MNSLLAIIPTCSACQKKYVCQTCLRRQTHFFKHGGLLRQTRLGHPNMQRSASLQRPILSLPSPSLITPFPRLMEFIMLLDVRRCQVTYLTYRPYCRHGSKRRTSQGEYLNYKSLFGYSEVSNKKQVLLKSPIHKCVQTEGELMVAKGILQGYFQSWLHSVSYFG